MRLVIAAKSGHLERIRDDAAGLIGKVLHVLVDVVVGDQHRFALLQQLLDFGLQGVLVRLVEHSRFEQWDFLGREGEVW